MGMGAMQALLKISQGTKPGEENIWRLPLFLLYFSSLPLPSSLNALLSSLPASDTVSEQLSDFVSVRNTFSLASASLVALHFFYLMPSCFPLLSALSAARSECAPRRRGAAEASFYQGRGPGMLASSGQAACQNSREPLQGYVAPTQTLSKRFILSAQYSESCLAISDWKHPIRLVLVAVLCCRHQGSLKKDLQNVDSLIARAVAEQEGLGVRRPTTGDFGAQEIQEQLEIFRKTVKVSDRSYHLRSYKNVFVGSEAVKVPSLDALLLSTRPLARRPLAHLHACLVARRRCRPW